MERSYAADKASEHRPTRRHQRHPVGTEEAGLNLGEMPACGHPIKPVADERQKTAGAHLLRPPIDDDLVDEIGIEKGARHRGPALDQHAGDAAAGKGLERVAHAKEAVIVDRNWNDLGAAILERIGIGMLFVGGADEPYRHHEVVE